MNKEDQILVLRDNAKAELMQIKSIEDGLGYLNKIKSIETWVKAEKKDAELQNLIAEQKLRTQRILGELIRQGQEKGEIASQSNGRPKEISVPFGNTYKKLDDIGLSRKQSFTFQMIAQIPEDDFESFIAEKKENVQKAVSELTTSGAVALAKKLRSNTDHKKTAGIMQKLAREKEMLAIAKHINDNFNKTEREFIKARIK